MTEEEWEKIVAYEKAQHRILCEFCQSFRYCRKICKTQERADACIHLHPKPKPEKPEPSRICPHCSKEFKSHYVKNGHMVSCPSNPKAEERNRKIAEAKTGKTRKKDTKERISGTMKETLAIKKDEDLKAVKSLPTTKNIKLKFF